MSPATLPFVAPHIPDTIERLLAQLEARPNERLRVLHHLLGEGACRQLGIYPIPADFKLSVVIPVYNECSWIDELLRRVQAAPIPKEIIVVDDASTDGTREILERLARSMDNVQVYFQERNQGKGAALREGFQHATGD